MSTPSTRPRSALSRSRLRTEPQPPGRAATGGRAEAGALDQAGRLQLGDPLGDLAAAEADLLDEQGLGDAGAGTDRAEDGGEAVDAFAGHRVSLTSSGFRQKKRHYRPDLWQPSPLHR